jgi:hypothetical protein
MAYPPVPGASAQLGTPVIAFHPCQEARFGSSDLPFSKPWTSNGVTYDNLYGVQTNCMRCYAGATYAVQHNSENNPLLYTADQFNDLDGPQFKGLIKTDFLWALAFNAK